MYTTWIGEVGLGGWEKSGGGDDDGGVEEVIYYGMDVPTLSSFLRPIQLTVFYSKTGGTGDINTGYLVAGNILLPDFDLSNIEWLSVYFHHFNTKTISLSNCVGNLLFMLKKTVKSESAGELLINSFR